MNAETIARWQFGITTVYHFLFVPLTIALSLMTAVLQSAWFKTKNDAYLRLTKFFGKLFLINFAMGVVTGIVQEFQFGMNWSEYSRFVGDIFGAPLALEALIAFFLESTFLGIWIFGWDRLKKGLHLTMIWLASIGSLISSIFIIAANAWMQNPVGAKYNSTSGRAELVSLMQVILNPVFLTQWPHTIAASFVTAGAFMAGIAAYCLAKANKENPNKTSDLVAYKKAVKFGAWFLIVAGVCSVVTGDLLGKEMVQNQPAKMAAAEDLTQANMTATGAQPFTVIPGVRLFPGFLNWLYGVDDQTMLNLSIDKVKSNCAANGYQTATGAPTNQLQIDVAQATQNLTVFTDPTMSNSPGAKVTIDPMPNVGVSFWSFRLRIGFGLLAVIGGIWLLIICRGSKVPKASGAFTGAMIALPLLPLLANSFGWIFTEMGRQPWIVNGVLPTQVAISPNLSADGGWGAFQVVLSVVLYTVVYAVLAVVEVKLLLKTIKAGLPDDVVVSVKDEGEELSFAY